MVTYLYALRWAVNIEVALAGLQAQRLRCCRDISARALPPLVPLVWADTALEDPALDRVRWSCPVRFAGLRAAPGTAPDSCPPALLELPGSGRMTADLARLVTTLLADLADGPVAAQPGIALAWRGCHPGEPPETGPCPVSLPATGAFWLSLLRIRFRGCAYCWEEGLEWDELFSRRVSRGER